MSIFRFLEYDKLKKSNMSGNLHEEQRNVKSTVVHTASGGTTIRRAHTAARYLGRDDVQAPDQKKDDTPVKKNPAASPEEKNDQKQAQSKTPQYGINPDETYGWIPNKNHLPREAPPMQDTAPVITGGKFTIAGVSGVLATNENPAAVRIPLSAIRPDPNQPRKLFAEDALISLGESIAHQGLVQPILVRPHPPDKDGRPINMFMIVGGERRWRASNTAGLTHINAIVKDLNDIEAVEAAIAENDDRKDMTTMETAIAYRSLYDVYLKRDYLDQGIEVNPKYISGEGWKGEVVAKVAKSRAVPEAKVRKMLEITTIHPELHKFVGMKDEDGKDVIAEHTARALAKLPLNKQIHVARRVMGMTTRDALNLIQAIKEAMAQEDMFLKVGLVSEKQERPEKSEMELNMDAVNKEVRSQQKLTDGISSLNKAVDDMMKNENSDKVFDRMARNGEKSLNDQVSQIDELMQKLTDMKRSLQQRASQSIIAEIFQEAQAAEENESQASLFKSLKSWLFKSRKVRF